MHGHKINECIFALSHLSFSAFYFIGDVKQILSHFSILFTGFCTVVFSFSVQFILWYLHFNGVEKISHHVSYLCSYFNI